MTLTEKFLDLNHRLDQDPIVAARMAALVEDAPASSERDGLLSLLYHEGIGVAQDLDKSFEYAEKAVSGCDALGFFMLGFMCDNAETPDQAEGGPRQKYDHYDAERFYERCARIDSHWREYALIWLGDYYMDFAKGGDPEIAVEYLESIADENAEAAGRLSDHYFALVFPHDDDSTAHIAYIDDEEWIAKLQHWTKVAAHLAPEAYAPRLDYLRMYLPR